MQFYFGFFDILNTNRRNYLQVFGNPNLYVISLFKVTSIYFTKVVNIHL